MIEIDGSKGEGGGQIIRTSLTLSAITQKPVKIINIRKNRPNPGLAMQHLTAAKSVRSVCRGTLEEAEPGSTILIYTPGEIIGGKYDFNIGTAGSVTLVAQTLIPILINAKKPSTIRIKGGTHVFKSPGYDYFEKVFIPALNYLGIKISSRLISTGYYPKGGGEIELTIEPSEIIPKDEWPKGEKIQGFIRLGSLPTHVGIREKKILMENNIEGVPLIEEKTLSMGNSLLIWKGFKGAYSLGQKGKRAEDVAQEAVDSLNNNLEFDLDERLADQIILYLSLKGKGSFTTSRITNHLKTNIEIISKFLETKIKIETNKVSLS